MHALFTGKSRLEDVYHWMMRCTAWTESRTLLIEKVNCMIDVPNMTDEGMADYAMDIEHVYK